MITITRFIGVAVAVSLASADAAGIEAPARATPEASACNFRRNAEVLKSNALIASSDFGALTALHKSLAIFFTPRAVKSGLAAGIL
jgi:hypothetical protein